MGRGVCSTTDPETFFPAKNKSAAAEAAKRVCSTCPVITDCLTYALADPGVHGVWGGTSDRQRADIRKGRTEGLVECDDCGARFASRRALGAHTRRRHPKPATTQENAA
jgi:WhiB family redox-sensing transcriptional regulator